METLDLASFKAKIFNFELSKDWKFEGKLPAIVDFYADWCGPCKMQAPILSEIATEFAGRLDVYKVDTEASPELSSLFHIRSIPTLLLIPLADKPALATGFMPKDALKRAIADVLKLS